MAQNAGLAELCRGWGGLSDEFRRCVCVEDGQRGSERALFFLLSPAPQGGEGGQGLSKAPVSCH